MNRVLLLDPRALHPHEDIDLDAANRILAMMKETQSFYPPVLVDHRTKIILDGHHRWWAAKQLGCQRIPCFCVNYLNDETIEVHSRRPSIRVSKAHVIEMGLSGKTFPIKTTRHIYTMPNSVLPYPLEELIRPGV